MYTYTNSYNVRPVAHIISNVFNVFCSNHSAIRLHPYSVVE